MAPAVEITWDQLTIRHRNHESRPNKLAKCPKRMLDPFQGRLGTIRAPRPRSDSRVINDDGVLLRRRIRLFLRRITALNAMRIHIYRSCSIAVHKTRKYGGVVYKFLLNASIRPPRWKFTKRRKRSVASPSIHPSILILTFSFCPALQRLRANVGNYRNKSRLLVACSSMLGRGCQLLSMDWRPRQRQG